MERILDYDMLVKIPGRDNGEPLLTVQDAVREILCRYEKLDMVPYLGERMLLRSGVVERLRRAALRLATLRPGARFRLVYGYRHPEVQRRYFEAHVARMTAQTPTLSAHEIRRRAHLLRHPLIFRPCFQGAEEAGPLGRRRLGSQTTANPLFHGKI